MSQSDFTDRWMRAAGVPPRERTGADPPVRQGLAAPRGVALVEEGGAAERGTQKQVNALLTELKFRSGLSGPASRLSPTRRPLARPLRVLITVSGKSLAPIGYQGHIVAYRIGAGAGAGMISYFDPNFGQFSFPGWDEFEAWFRYYFDKSHYNTYMGSYFKLRFY